MKSPGNKEPLWEPGLPAMTPDLTPQTHQPKKTPPGSTPGRASMT
jgi:hypothetical protein